MIGIGNRKWEKCNILLLYSFLLKTWIQALEANAGTHHSFSSPMREGWKEKGRKEESPGSIPDTLPLQLQVRILHDEPKTTTRFSYKKSALWIWKMKISYTKYSRKMFKWKIYIHIQELGEFLENLIYVQ